MQMFVEDEKIFTLPLVDERFKMINMRYCDGDKPSPLVGISLSVIDSNLHQHGEYFFHYHVRFIHFV